MRKKRGGCKNDDNGPPPPCGEPHIKNGIEEGKCKLELGHDGNHVCDTCKRSYA